MRQVLIFTFLVALGLLQIGASLAGQPTLRGVALATGASPAPKVFSTVRGLETYSSRFFLEWDDRTGRTHSVPVDPGRAAGLRGPYQRRNTYGAVVAYGPVLAASEATRPLFDSVAAFGLCGDAPLLRELGVDADDRAGPLRLRVVPGLGTNPEALPLNLEAPCS